MFSHLLSGTQSDAEACGLHETFIWTLKIGIGVHHAPWEQHIFSLQVCTGPSSIACPEYPHSPGKAWFHWVLPNLHQATPLQHEQRI